MTRTGGGKGLIRENSPGFERLYRLTAFAGIYFLVSAFAVPAASKLFGRVPKILLFAAVLAVMVLGNLFQAAIAALRKIKRPESGSEYEADVRFWRLGAALPAAVPALAVSFAAANFASSYLETSAGMTGAYYDPDSVLPFLAGLISFAVFMMGSFVWFFPYDRLMAGRGAVVGLTVSTVGFFLFTAARFDTQGVNAVCMAGYAVCAMVASNQFNVGKSYHGIVTTSFTNRARGYNLLLVGGLIVSFALLSGVLYILFSGLATLIRLVFAAMIASAASRGGSDAGYIEEPPDEEVERSSIYEYIFGKAEPKATPEYWYLIIFAVFAVLAITYVLLSRTDFMKRLVSAVVRFFTFIFEALFRPIADFFSRGTPSDYFFLSYSDEEEKLTEEDERRIRSRRTPEKPRRNWHEFSSELASRKTGREKFRFAYSQLASLLSEAGHAKRSDTPREIGEKLKSRSSREDPRTVDAVTKCFEEVEFGGRTEVTPESLDAVCEMVKKNI